MNTSLSKIDISVLVIGIFVLYFPTFWDLANGLWQAEEQSHGFIVLGLVIWLFYRTKDKLLATPCQPSNLWGNLFFILGILIYTVGRIPNVQLFEVGSMIPVIIGVTLLMIGPKGLKPLGFPLFFIIFMIPIPGSIIDALTQPMKIAVSYVAENVLYNLGFPIARTGVVLHIGPYQLLVANVCAGMHTLISLEGLGLLYLNLVEHDSKFRNIFLAILIIPISFTANVIRVMTLTLVTFYFGDEVGQGFIHGFAGIVLFSVALMLIISADSAVQYYVEKRMNNVNKT